MLNIMDTVTRTKVLRTNELQKSMVKDILVEQSLSQVHEAVDFQFWKKPSGQMKGGLSWLKELSSQFANRIVYLTKARRFVSNQSQLYSLLCPKTFLSPSNIHYHICFGNAFFPGFSACK